MKKACLLTLAIALSFLGVDSAVAVVTFDWATVGDPRNVADTRVMDKGPGTPDLTTGYGSVGYEYEISKYHVTNSQYTEFLNAVDPNGDVAEAALDPFDPDRNGIYNLNMSSSTIGLAYTGGIDYSAGATAGSKYSVKSGQANYPATWINWDTGARFVNWLSNGQGTGSTETGVYNMALAFPARQARQAGATVFMPSEDEFYKAAYYDPTKGGSGGYWEYGVQSDTSPVSAGPPGGATSANYRGSTEADTFWQTGLAFDNSENYLIDVGSYSTAMSYYGLFDVDGEVYQWTEDGTQTAVPGGTQFPVFRGGSWYYWSDDVDLSDDYIGASYRNLYSFPDVISYAWFGLRIAQAVTLTADFNEDGAVNDVDLGIWESSLGVNAGADADDDGDSDGADFLAWQQQFTGDLSPPMSAATTVPEPSSVVLLFTLVAASILYRQRRCAI